jgi:hypothetical protein
MSGDVCAFSDDSPTSSATPAKDEGTSRDMIPDTSHF